MFGMTISSSQAKTLQVVNVKLGSISNTLKDSLVLSKVRMELERRNTEAQRRKKREKDLEKSKKKDNPKKIYTLLENGEKVFIDRGITLYTHSKLGRIIVQPSRINSGGGYGYVKLLYQYEVIDEPIDLFSKIPHGKIIEDLEKELFRKFLLSQEEVV